MSLAAAGLIVLAATTKVDGSYLGILFGLVPMSIGMGSTFVPLTLVATTASSPRTQAWPLACSTPPSRSAARWGWRSSRRWPTRADLVLTGLGHAPSQANQNAALVDGFQLAFTVSAG